MKEMVEIIACMRERRGACRVLLGRPEGIRPLGRPRCKWQDSFKIDFQKMRWGAGTGFIWLR
jgi:hypothetical protein